MASMNYVASKLSAAGLTVDVDGEFILVEDPYLDFERSHDGVRGISRFCAETLEEYAEVCAELFKDPVYDEESCGDPDPDEGTFGELVGKYIDLLENKRRAEADLLGIALEEEANSPMDESPYPDKEKPMNTVEAQIQAELEEFAPAPPVKDHAGPAAQMEMARKFHSPKEIARAAQISDQDRGGIPSPEDYIRDMKMAAPAVAVLVKGQRFMAPDGWTIKERRPTGQVLYYGSIFQARKARYQAQSSAFSLVRDL